MLSKNLVAQIRQLYIPGGIKNAILKWFIK